MRTPLAPLPPTLPSALCETGVLYFLSPLESGYRQAMKLAAISGNPDIMGGTPCLTGTRVPFQTLLDYLEGGNSLEEFLADFPSVSRDLAVSALQEAGDLALARARVA